MNEQVIDLTADEVVPPRRSRRLATIIPASYWISMGYSQAQATAMERLQTDIKNYCNGGNETEILLQERASLISIGEILLHHELLLPHWDKFANELRGRNSVTRVRLRGISLPPPVLDIVFPALQSMNSLINLTLYRNDLGNEGYQRLVAFLEGNSKLIKLSIVESVVDDISVARSFSDALKSHSTLERLIFNKCGLNNIPILGEILEGCRGMESLGILNADLGSAAVALIASFIRSNKTIEILRLNGNKITDVDALVLASALDKNTHLRQIDLQNNNITEEGEKTLLKTMYDPTSMDSIVESIPCVAYTRDIEKPQILAQLPRLEREVVNINANKEYSIGQKIRKKVILALCGVGGELFDLSLLNDLPLQLMPRVLELLQEHTIHRTKVIMARVRLRSMPRQISDKFPRLANQLRETQRKHLEKDALARLFHTLRGWELPLLFENLNKPSANSGKRKRRKTRR